MSGGGGAFGKMPAVGDFFRVNTPPGFVSVWDNWVQSAMLTAQDRLGAGWDAAYMSAPIWRFSLSPGLAGTRKVLGVLMPSIDRVGRRFPLTLMIAPDTETSADLDHFAGEAFFGALETLALDALEDEMTRDGLGHRLAELPAPPDGDARAHKAWNGSLAASGPVDGATALPGLASMLLAGRCAAPSVWSCLTGDGPRMLVCDGLPQGDDMHGLFDLNAALWNERGLS